MQLASQGTSLHISHVELSHSGLFACQATNEAGTAGAEVEVSVHGEQVSGALGQWETQWWGWWSWTRDLSVLGGLLARTSKDMLVGEAVIYPVQLPGDVSASCLRCFPS